MFNERRRASKGRIFAWAIMLGILVFVAAVFFKGPYWFVQRLGSETPEGGSIRAVNTGAITYMATYGTFPKTLVAMGSGDKSPVLRQKVKHA
jgi:hypothetical protein